MSFTESQQKIIDYVSTDESVKNDFLHERNILLQGYEQTRSEEERDKQMLQMALDYFKCALDNKDQEAEALKQIYQETI